MPKARIQVLRQLMLRLDAEQMSSANDNQHPDALLTHTLDYTRVKLMEFGLLDSVEERKLALKTASSARAIALLTATCELDDGYCSLLF